MINSPYKIEPALPDTWLSPDDEQVLPFLDKELGGVDLNDPTQGLRVQEWTLTYNPATGNMEITDEALNTTVLFNRAGITQISLAFDQNMNPFVSFTQMNGQTPEAWYWWFDTDLAQTVFTQLSAAAKNPVCCLDDKRESQTFSSDIILAYVEGNTLYFRAERDRFTVPYVFDDTLPDNTICTKVGMHVNNRLQFEMFTLQN